MSEFSLALFEKIFDVTNDDFVTLSNNHIDYSKISYYRKGERLFKFRDYWPSKEIFKSNERVQRVVRETNIWFRHRNVLEYTYRKVFENSVPEGMDNFDLIYDLLECAASNREVSKRHYALLQNEDNNTMYQDFRNMVDEKYRSNDFFVNLLRSNQVKSNQDLDNYYSSKEYIDKAVETCKSFYGDNLALLSYGTQVFPDIAIVASEELKKEMSIYENSSLTIDEKMEGLERLVNMPEFFKLDESQPTEIIVEKDLPEELQSRVNEKVKKNNTGFKRQKMLLNDSGQIIGMNFGICKYRENVITSEILTYGIKNDDNTFRNIIKNETGEGLSSLLNADMYNSIVGTQCIVLFYNSKHNYIGYKAKEGILWTKLLQRSKEVYEKIGCLQFSGVGSFTVRAGENPIEAAIKGGFDIFSSLKCEYVEELFGAKEKHTGEDSTGQKKQLESMIMDGKAFIEFLGVSAALDTLKTDLVYLLLITDDSYVNNHFDSNFEDEADGAYVVPIDKVVTLLKESEYIKGRELVGPIELLKHSKLLQKLDYTALQ